MMPFSLKLLVIILGMIVAIGPLSIDMYLPGLPAIQTGFNATAAEVQLTLSAFLVGYSLGQLIYGPLSDRFGRKPVLLSGISLFTLSSLLCAVSVNIESLIVLRFLQAAGGGAGVVLARAIVRDYFPANETARLLSLISVVTLCAPLVAPVLGGYLLVWAGWRSIFWTLSGFGICYLLLIATAIRESHPPEKRQPLNITTTFSAYREILSHRQSLGYILSSTLSAAAIFAYIASAPFVFIEVYGIRPDNFGYLYALITSGLIICAIINSRLVTRAGLDKMIIYGHLIRISGVVILILLAVFETGGLAGVVFALILCVSPTIIININSAAGLLHIFPQYSGTASSISGAAMFAGGAVAAPVVGIFHENSIMPLTLTMAVFSCASIATYWLLVIRSSPRDNH
jgi:DHA1 family bicyclomycin/chloramphenicol resistance-like MFS transporter